MTSEMSSDASQYEVNDAQVQLIEQEKMLLHLRDMVRDCQESLAAKDAELQVHMLICTMLQRPALHVSSMYMGLAIYCWRLPLDEHG